MEICLYSLYRNKLLTKIRKRGKNDRSPCSFSRKRRHSSHTSQAAKKKQPFSREYLYLKIMQQCFSVEEKNLGK